MTVSDALADRLRESFGLRRGVVALAAADPSWPVVFHLLAAELIPQLPESVVSIEHVGSTAVPGLPAKPILDLAVGVRDGANPTDASAALRSFGFTLRGEADGPGLDRNFGFELDDRVRLINAHMVHFAGSEWTAYVRFRDQLRANPSARDAYAKIKHELAATHTTDRRAYIDGKTAFVHGTR